MVQVTEQQARHLVEDGFLHRQFSSQRVYRPELERKALEKVRYAKFLRRLARAVAGR